MLCSCDLSHGINRRDEINLHLGLGLPISVIHYRLIFVFLQSAVKYNLKVNVCDSAKRVSEQFVYS